MSHKSGHVIIFLIDDLKDLEDRLEKLSEDKREKVLEIVEKARQELEALGD